MTHRNIISVLLTTALCSFASTAFSQGFPVDDAVNKRIAAENLQVDQQNLAEQTQQTRSLNVMLDAVGQPGGGMTMISSDAFKGIGSSSDFYDNLEKFGFDMCAINLCQVGHNPQNTTDVNEAREWANKTFYSSVELNPRTQNDLLEVRRRAVAYAATNALAISATVHNELAESGGAAKTLEDFVHSQTSFRGDIQANSAVALAQYKIALQQLAVLTTILDVQASTAISSTDIYHENGAVEFPDAYSEYDFRDDMTRQSVTIPTKGTAN